MNNIMTDNQNSYSLSEQRPLAMAVVQPDWRGYSPGLVRDKPSMVMLVRTWWNFTPEPRRTTHVSVSLGKLYSNLPRQGVRLGMLLPLGGAVF